jgi:hypothetical protein
MSHALSARERTKQGTRHCAKRATLPAQLAADCTSDPSASASDENSAALELHEPIVPLARERRPGRPRHPARARGRRTRGCDPGKRPTRDLAPASLEQAVAIERARAVQRTRGSGVKGGGHPHSRARAQTLPAVGEAANCCESAVAADTAVKAANRARFRRAPISVRGS